MKNQKLDLLQKQKSKFQLELSNLLQSSSKDLDKINELRSEIIYIDKQIEKILGKKEFKMQTELKKQKYRIEDINKKNYYDLKTIVDKINPMKIATNRIIKIIESKSNINSNEEKVRVKV